jgi:glucose uptake protein GlcU
MKKAGVFWRHTIIAFVVQFVATVIIHALGLILISFSDTDPSLERLGSLLADALNILYVPTMGLVMVLLKLFHLPSADGLLTYFGGWLLGALIYSLLWGAIMAWRFSRTL